MSLLFLLASAHAACPSLDAEVERATGALVAGDFKLADQALAAAADSFACAPVTRADLARYWLLVGASAHLQGRKDAARGPLAAARRNAPTVYDDRLGPDVRAAWASATPTGSGTLLLEPARPAFLDGEGIAEWPVPVDDAPHLVQVVGPNGTVLFGREVHLVAGDDALVQTGLGTAEPLPDAPPPPPPPVAKRSPAMLIVAGVAAAGAGACAGGRTPRSPR